MFLQVFLFYFLPVLFVSVLLNLSRWFELRLQDILVLSNGTTVEIDTSAADYSATNHPNGSYVVVTIAGTSLRYNPSYVTYYLHWTILISTGIAPLVALAFLNTRIYFRIKEVQKIRTSTSRYVRVTRRGLKIPGKYNCTFSIRCF